MAKPNKLEVEEGKLATARSRFAEHEQKQKAKVIPPVLDRLIEYKDFFVRDENLFTLKTKSSDRAKQTLELVRFLFQKYPVPSFMNYVWSHEKIDRGPYINGVKQPDKINGKFSEYEMWYICVATGGSLHKEYLKSFLTKKESHTFLNCKFDITIPQTLVFAIAKADGAKDGNALRVAHSKLVSKKLDDFWKYVICFMAKEDAITVDKINDLVDYLNHKRTETPVGGHPFTMAGMGYTLTSLTKKMVDWHYSLRRMKAIGVQTWEGSPLPDRNFGTKGLDGKTIHWSIKQIKSAKALQEEGNKQRHCVLSYKQRCINGEISIWSLTNQDEYGGVHRKLTIELSKTGQIVQKRGISNRNATAVEDSVLNTWCKQDGIGYSEYRY